MSILDKIVAAVTPPESDQDRIEARQMAEQYVDRAPWLAMVLDHHRQIDAAFETVKQATDAGQKRQALRELGTLLTGHSIAEEAVIYPSLSDVGDTGHATMAYTEQAAAKMQIGLLERMDPMSQDFDDKFGHLEGAVKHHVYQEEGNWFRQLADAADDTDHQMIADRYTEEFNRYMNGGSSSADIERGNISSNNIADENMIFLEGENQSELESAEFVDDRQSSANADTDGRNRTEGESLFEEENRSENNDQFGSTPTRTF